MKSAGITVRYLVMLGMAAGLLRCSVETVGNSTDVTSAERKVGGVVYNKDGSRAVNAGVVMRSSTYLPDTEHLFKKKTADGNGVCSTKTDGNGRFAFTSSQIRGAGEYVLDIVSHDGSMRKLLDSLVLDSAFLSSGTWLGIDTPAYDPVLREPGILFGTVASGGRDPVRGKVFIYGMDDAVAIDENGTYRLTGVPAGDLKVKVVTETESGSRQTRDIMVSVNPGDSSPVDTLYRVEYSTTGITGGGEPPSVNMLYLSGEMLAVPSNSGEMEKPGYVFDGWSTGPDDEGAVVKPGDSLAVAGDGVTLYPRWHAIAEYTLSLEFEGPGSVKGQGTVASGESRSIEAVPDEGAGFLRWEILRGEGQIEDAHALSTMVSLSSDATIVAMFSREQYREYVLSGNSTGRAIRMAEDGGFIVTGAITDTMPSAAGYADLLMLRVDRNGDTLWSRTFGGDRYDIGTSVLQAGDGGFIAAGVTFSFGASGGVYLVKVTSSGEEMWSRVINSSNSSQGCVSMVPTFDGGYIIGSGDGGGELIKVNGNGNEEWRKDLGRSQFRSSCAVKQVADSGFVLGMTFVDDQDTYFMGLVKTDRMGNTLWSRSFIADSSDTIQNHFRTGIAVEVAEDGGVVLLGETYETVSGFSDIYVCKVTADGTELWHTLFGCDMYDRPRSIHVTMDGGFLIGGWYDGGMSLMAKVNASGVVEWMSQCPADLSGSSSGVSTTYFDPQEAGDMYFMTGSASSGMGAVSNCVIKIADKTGYGN